MDEPNTKTAMFAGATIAFLIAIGHLYWQVDRVRSDVVDLRGTITTEFKKLRESAGAAPASNTNRRAPAVELNGKALEQLKAQIEDELNSTRKQVGLAATRAKSEAVAHAEQLAKRIGEETQNQHKEVNGELGELKQTEANTHAKVEEVSEAVANVRGEVAATRYELEKTIADLKHVTGDMGVQSGLIATNGRELQALRMLGERNYFEFHIQKSSQAQRVGDISMVLKKTDPKHNRYTVEVVVADKKTEKKDRGINEPVQFYTSKSRVPAEIVVNEVQKDHIIGYLATPKEHVVARNY